MKKFILFTLAAIVVLLVVLGPDLLNLYRLQRFVDTSSAAAQADGGPWPSPTDVCTGCHGAQGSTQSQGYPSLAAQPAPYLAAQLRNFAYGQRANPNMGPLSMTLSEAEIKSLSEHFSREPAAENNSFQPDPALREKGRQLVAAGGCAGCHGEHLMGHDQFPRLAGQAHDYLLAQFDEFAADKRSEPSGTMKRIALAASPQDREALASYLASLPPAHQ